MAITSKQPSWRTDKRNSTERGYTWAWTKARNAYLKDNPLCVMCMAMKPSKVTAANVVDHSTPHRGDMEIFWDQSRWQSLCKQHHDSDAQIRDKGGKQRAKFDENGCVIW